MEVLLNGRSYTREQILASAELRQKFVQFLDTHPDEQTDLEFASLYNEIKTHPLTRQIQHPPHPHGVERQFGSPTVFASAAPQQHGSTRTITIRGGVEDEKALASFPAEVTISERQVEGGSEIEIGEVGLSVSRENRAAVIEQVAPNFHVDDNSHLEVVVRDETTGTERTYVLTAQDLRGANGTGVVVNALAVATERVQEEVRVASAAHETAEAEQPAVVTPPAAAVAAPTQPHAVETTTERMVVGGVSAVTSASSEEHVHSAPIAATFERSTNAYVATGKAFVVNDSGEPSYDIPAASFLFTAIQKDFVPNFSSLEDLLLPADIVLASVEGRGETAPVAWQPANVFDLSALAYAHFEMLRDENREEFANTESLQKNQPGHVETLSVPSAVASSFGGLFFQTFGKEVTTGEVNPTATTFIGAPVASTLSASFSGAWVGVLVREQRAAAAPAHSKGQDSREGNRQFADSDGRGRDGSREQEQLEESLMFA